MKNPFLIKGYISADYFCDREKETADLTRFVTNENNVILVSPRRMGKTGLIEHCFRQKEIAKHYYTFFVDIYATRNMQELVYKMGKEIFERLKPRGKKFVENFFSVISSLRPAFKLDEMTGAPVFDIGIGEIHSAEITLEEIFKYLNASDKPCIVAIDEFQQIAKYPEKNIEAILRTHVQKTTKTTFIFSGSQRHILHNMFFSASRPFYQSAVLQSLDAIDRKKYIQFADRHFRRAGKKVDKSFIERAYDLFEGHTFYVQAIMNQLFSELDEYEDCTGKKFENALKNRVFSYETLFSEILNILPERQREVLYAVAKEGKAVNISSGEFVKKHSLLSPSSTQTAARQLVEKEIFTRNEHTYSVYDRFFGLWLQTYYGTLFH
ncbi:MAG: ATP-binding protein [Bacteroidales bacterium]|jgi:AAA+ ATPase superfamily predicted ATPase|nr:ATP-binding protein [Bacteroidales bacterium]